MFVKSPATHGLNYLNIATLRGNGYNLILELVDSYTENGVHNKTTRY